MINIFFLYTTYDDNMR